MMAEDFLVRIVVLLMISSLTPWMNFISSLVSLILHLRAPDRSSKIGELEAGGKVLDSLTTNTKDFLDRTGVGGNTFTKYFVS